MRFNMNFQRAGFLFALAGSSFLVGQSFGDPVESTAPAIQCLEQLASLSWCELEELYRQSAPGAIPNGYASGKVIYPPCERHAGRKAHCAETVWKGKHFCAEQGTLINQWLGFKAIRGRVYYGPSWLDGKESIILDYCGESRVWADMRAEMREVAPGLYVGIEYLRRCPEPKLKLMYCLQANCCR
jgi:hypothetical protein